MQTSLAAVQTGNESTVLSGSTFSPQKGRESKSPGAIDTILFMRRGHNCRQSNSWQDKPKLPRQDIHESQAVAWRRTTPPKSGGTRTDVKIGRTLSKAITHTTPMSLQQYVAINAPASCSPSLKRFGATFYL